MLIIDRLTSIMLICVLVCESGPQSGRWLPMRVVAMLTTALRATSKHVAPEELQHGLYATVARQVLREHVRWVLRALNLPQVDPPTANLVLEPQTLRVDVAELS